MTLCRGAVGLALCAALGCGPAPAPARPDPSVGRVKRYRPLEMASDARQPGRAVILGTDDAGGSTVLALPLAPLPVVVDVMGASRSDAGTASGAIQAVVLTAGPGPAASGAAERAAAAGAGPARAIGGAEPVPPAQPGGGAEPAPPAQPGGGAEPVAPVQVGGADEEGLAGARWRADAWSAALIAATALGKDLADVTLSATPAGPVDGPASAVLAGGFVAAMLGDAIDPAATLAGAIQPDGTIGPVAGLPEQLAAALARGKTRIGYPSGMRVARSLATGKDVDVVQLARSHRAEAIELADVRDAYRLLTGHRLPAPVPVGAAAMALEPAVLAKLDAMYLNWQRKLADEWAPLLQLEQAGRLPAPVTVLLRVARGRSERAEALHRAGKPVAAYGDILGAWLHAAAANHSHAVIGKLAAGDAGGARAALAALDPGEAIRAIFDRIAERAPATLAGHLAMIEALQAALRGWAYHELAADSLRTTTQLLDELVGKSPADLGAPATAAAVSGAVAPTVLRMLRAAAEVAVAEQELELGPEAGVACACAPDDLARDAAALQAAAAAALGQADAMLVEPLARQANIPADAARSRIASLDPDYAIADQLARRAATGVPRDLAAAWGDGSLPAGLLALAAARAAYLDAALVLARHDALGVHGDDTGRIDAVRHPRAIRALLAGAERTARAAARAAQVATGAIPVQARLAYQVAIAEAGGAIDDQLDALAELWTATALSDTAVVLARACR